MTTKTFIVTVTASDSCDSYLNTEYVHEALRGTGVRVDSVSDYNPTAPARISKIPAIKRIRGLLGSTFLDSKAMADAAQAMGEFRMLGIVVNYEAESNSYRVIDTRPEADTDERPRNHPRDYQRKQEAV